MMNKPKFGLSYEFFPPKTAEQQVILKRHPRKKLRETHPDFSP